MCQRATAHLRPLPPGQPGAAIVAESGYGFEEANYVDGEV